MRVPEYRRHATGQGYVRIPCTDDNVYFGIYELPGSRQKYEAWKAAYLAHGGNLPKVKSPSATTINDISAAYLHWAEEKFQKRGRSTGHVKRITAALGQLCRECGDLAAEGFTIQLFEKVQARMVGLGWSRSYVNSCGTIVKTLFSWAGVREFISMERASRVEKYPGLVKGQTLAPETEPIKPVEKERVWATLDHLGRIPGIMVQIQWYTGCRPGEVCAMRVCDIDRSSQPWTYRPASHKTEHHGADRSIYLGPECRELLAELIMERVVAQELQAFLFSPKLAKEEAIEKDGRKIKNGCAKPGESYPTASYTRAVARACKRAGVEPWSPLQLRHSRLTATRSEFGPDAARAQAGHRSLSSTQVYAELDMDKAKNVAEKTG